MCSSERTFQSSGFTCLSSFPWKAFISNLLLWGSGSPDLYAEIKKSQFLPSWNLNLTMFIWTIKSRKSRDTWSDRKVWPWSTKWTGAKANRVLPRECTGYSKHSLPTTQETSLHMDITRWSIPKSDWLYSLHLKMEKLYTVRKNKTRSWLDSDHELFIAKFRLQLKKVGKTTRPFRYDLNQIPYDYTVEVTNRLKAFDLIECLKNYGEKFMTLYRRQ